MTSDSPPNAPQTTADPGNGYRRQDVRAAVSIIPLLLLATLSAGCHLWKQNAKVGNSPLRPATPSSDSVTLEIWTVRTPSADVAHNESIWNEVDETQVPSALRRELKRNGVRAGVIGGGIPGTIARLLDLDDSTPVDGDVWQTVDLRDTPRVTRRIKQIRNQGDFEIAPSVTVHDELHLLERDNGRARGRTYHNAQAAFRATTQLASDGRAHLQFTPELHFGDARQAISLQSGGTPRYDMARPKEVYQELTARFTLAPGEMLLLGRASHRSGGIGHYLFHEESAEGPQQRLLLVRLARAPPGELFEDNVD